MSFRGSTQARLGAHRSMYLFEIFSVSFAVLLLEIGFTRMVSYKLFYYFTYLVIGLALLGLGAGGVLVAVSRRVRRASTDAILLRSLTGGAAAVGLSYLVVALLPTDTITIWHYDGTGARNALLLLVLSLALFAAFLPAGVVLATLFGRRPDGIGRMYVADLVGAGIACALVVPLIDSRGAPITVACAGLLFAVTGLRIAVRRRSWLAPVAGGLAAIALVATFAPSLVPDVRLDDGKRAGELSAAPLVYSSWSPNFRVDVRDFGGSRLLFHDGLVGSGMLHWDGRRASLASFQFDRDVRSIPFAVAGSPPARQVIIGAAAGHEVVASLYFNAGHIDAVELNPVTVDLVRTKMADYDGRLAQNPRVNYVNADARSFLARSYDRFNLVWFPAPDSYSATNAATSSAFVLSESYLYTSEAVRESLRHLAPGGIIAAQFGEDPQAPNRTIRYIATARDALAGIGVRDASAHILVATVPNVALARSGEKLPGVNVSILVKATPFTPAEIGRFSVKVQSMPGSVIRYLPGHSHRADVIAQAVAATGAGLDDIRSAYPYSVGAVSDDKPFFWHFTPFTSVLRHFTEPIGGPNLEVAVGERVLLLLLGIAVLLAVVFLLLPFLTIRDTWAALPRKRWSVVYFAALGLGFMFFEITLIQKLVLFLGYPTYSLTVTLSSLLIFTGGGAYLSGRWAAQTSRVVRKLLGVLAALTGYYLFGLQPSTNALQQLPLAGRVGIAFAVVAPLGLCLGMFLPLGVRAVAGLCAHTREYVAWGWAVNGFASVIGSVLATILAMTFGFRVVLVLAFLAYLLALAALRLLTRAVGVLDDIASSTMRAAISASRY